MVNHNINLGTFWTVGAPFRLKSCISTTYFVFLGTYMKKRVYVPNTAEGKNRIKSIGPFQSVLNEGGATNWWGLCLRIWCGNNINRETTTTNLIFNAQSAAIILGQNNWLDHSLKQSWRPERTKERFFVFQLKKIQTQIHTTALAVLHRRDKDKKP